MNLRSFLIPVGLILAVAASRLLPHPPNFTPVMSVALFGSAVFANRYMGILVAIAAMAISNLILGPHSTWPYVYAAMVLTGLLGFFLREKRDVLRILGLTVAGSVLFFVITNLGVILSQDLYPKTFAGLVTCYTMALPFFRNSLAGDMVFSAGLFGLHYILMTRFDRNTAAKAV